VPGWPQERHRTAGALAVVSSRRSSRELSSSSPGVVYCHRASPLIGRASDLLGVQDRARVIRGQDTPHRRRLMECVSARLPWSQRHRLLLLLCMLRFQTEEEEVRFTEPFLSRASVSIKLQRVAQIGEDVVAFTTAKC